MSETYKTMPDADSVDLELTVQKLKVELAEKEKELEEAFWEYEQYRDMYNTPPDEVEKLKKENEKLQEKVNNLNASLDAANDRAKVYRQKWEKTRNGCVKLKKENQKLREFVEWMKSTVERQSKKDGYWCGICDDSSFWSLVGDISYKLDSLGGEM